MAEGGAADRLGVRSAIFSHPTRALKKAQTRVRSAEQIPTAPGVPEGLVREAAAASADAVESKAQCRASSGDAYGTENDGPTVFCQCNNL